MPLALIFAAALAAGAADPPPAPSVNASAPAPASAKAAYDPDKVVCKYIATTGTRFMTKECHRQGDWDQLAADSKKLTSDAQAGFTKSH